MALMRTCCCFQKLSNACKATGIFTIVVAILGILWHLSSVFSKTIPYWSSGMAFSLYLVAAVLDGVLLLGGVFLLAGAFKGYSGRYLVLAFIMMMVIYLVVDISCAISTYYVIHTNHGSQVWKNLAVIISFVVWIIPVPFFIIGEIVAISFFQELLEEKRPDSNRSVYMSSYLYDNHRPRNGPTYPPSDHNSGLDRRRANQSQHRPQSDRSLSKRFDRFGERVSFAGGYSDVYRQYNSDPGYKRPAQPPVNREKSNDRSRFRDSLGLYGRPYVHRPSRISSLVGSSDRPSALAREYF